MAVYPRVCGGTPSRLVRQVSASGLSPRVRGNHPLPRHSRQRRRSIPACAGEPRPDLVENSDEQVYPRVCGGTPFFPVQGQGQFGLSPRVRGNP